MPEIAISPLPDAVRRIAGKTPVAARLSSAEWARVPLALRERAQFSARVESLRVLAEIQEKLERRIGMAREQVARGEAWVGREDFIADVRRVAVAEGVQTTGEAGAGGLLDIRSNRRLGLIYDFQTRQAAEFARWQVGEDPDVLDAYPAQELIREEDRVVPRDWRTRWAGNGGRFYDGRMIALKSDPIWQKISAFGTPFPPFDFGSGMGIEDVSRDEAEELGVLPRGKKVRSVEKGFNDEVEASVENLPPSARQQLADAFGDQVEIRDGKARWQGTLIQDLVDAVQPNVDVGVPPDNQVTKDLKVRFGRATEVTRAKAAAAGIELPAKAQLTLTADNVFHLFARHGEDAETRGDQRPLTRLDIEMMPHVWRAPERVAKGKGTAVVFEKVLDGMLRLVTLDRAGTGGFVPTSMVVRKG